MRNKKLKAKFMTSALAVAMAASLLPASVLAQTEGGNGANGTISTKIKDNTETGGGSDDGQTGGGPGGGQTGGGPGGGQTGGGHGGGTEYSDSMLTVPEGLEDGTYAGTATVQADEKEEFTNYTIRVSVTISDGKITNVALAGAGGNNLAYSNDALSGILRNVPGTGAGELEVDTVSGATCSSKAIVKGMNAALQGEVSHTIFSVNDGNSSVTYLPEGSIFTVKITNPVEGVDYSKIGLAYGVGKFADDLSSGNDFFVKQLSKTDADVTYQIEINPSAYYEIDDDGLVHSELYNTPGRNLTLTVGDEGLGTIYIRSDAYISIENNVISLNGGNGETLSDYLDLVDEVTVGYYDDNGNQVTKTYNTRWQHDIDPAFTGKEIFNEDGSINFDITAMVTQIGDDNEAEKNEDGSNVTYKEAVFPNGADGNYMLKVTAGDGYDEISAWVGKDYAAKTPTTITLADKSATYTGKAVSIGTANVTGNTGTVTYTYYTDSSCTKKTSSTDGASTAGAAPANAGTYYVTASAAETDNYAAATSSAAKLTIKKAAQTINVKTTSKTYKTKKIQKAAKTFNIGASANGTLTYSKKSGSSILKLNKKTGQITVPKGTAKGTYKIQINIAAKATNNYKANTVTKTVTVKIK